MGKELKLQLCGCKDCKLLCWLPPKSYCPYYHCITDEPH